MIMRPTPCETAEVTWSYLFYSPFRFTKWFIWRFFFPSPFCKRSQAPVAPFGNFGGCANKQTKLNLWLQEQCFELARRMSREWCFDNRSSFQHRSGDEEHGGTWILIWKKKKHLNFVPVLLSFYGQNGNVTHTLNFILALRQIPRADSPHKYWTYYHWFLRA